MWRNREAFQSARSGDYRGLGVAFERTEEKVQAQEAAGWTPLDAQHAQAQIALICIGTVGFLFGICMVGLFVMSVIK